MRKDLSLGGTFSIRCSVFWGLALFALAGLLPAGVAESQDSPRADLEEDRALREFLRPVPALEPGDALASFELLEGFELQLAAHEPLVFDPVAGAFDEDGRLYIAELTDYPYRPAPGSSPSGRIRLLEDTDGDGIFDRSHLFADELLWPTGVAVWRGGIFVAASPDIWYLKDTDGDGRADVRRKVFQGFGTQKAQGSLNNLIWGVDHQIYGAGSVNGGEIHAAGEGPAESITLERQDFRFDPNSERIEIISGGAQFGNTFDDWYQRFLCSQGTPAFHVILPRRYLQRNPYYAAPRGILNLAKGPTPIFRISPLEHWRIIRSTRRINSGFAPAKSVGVNQHVLDGAAGSTVYRGDAFPPEFRGSLFVGGAQTNLVHRMKLQPDGVTFRAERADAGTEFLRSTDNWFRPVNFLNGPDGALYVLDLYRGQLEATHIPHDVARHLDLTRGRDRGRIYRVVPAGFRAPPPPKLSGFTTAQLVAALEHPRGWQRETAHRLLFERQDGAAIAPLRRMLRHSKRPRARLHAMWSLVGLGRLAAADLAIALEDPEPGVVQHALRLAETELASEGVYDRVLGLAQHADIRVRYQAAFSLGYRIDERSIQALAMIAERDAENQWIRAAVISSVPEASAQLMQALVGRPANSVPRATVRQLAEVAGIRNHPPEVRAALQIAAAVAAARTDLRDEIVRSLARGLHRSGEQLFAMKLELAAEPRSMLSGMLSAARQTAGCRSSSPATRAAAIELLGFSAANDALQSIPLYLQSDQPPAVQSAAVAALANFPIPQTGVVLLRNWASSTPAVRAEMLDTLFQRDEWIELLLAEIEDGELTAGVVGLNRQDQLRSHSDPKIRARAARLFRAAGDRQEVIGRYQAALSAAGDRRRGQAIFRRECSNCHRYQNQGYEVGPNLALTRGKSAQELLRHILDPNLEVEPQFLQYSIVDRQGRVHAGSIKSETPTAITLTRGGDQVDTVLRTEVDEIVSSGKSLMPAGLEEKISVQQMSDLLAFLLDIQYDLGTDPGLIEPAKPLEVAALSLTSTRSSEASAQGQPTPGPLDEAYIFTPPGFDRAGVVRQAEGAQTALLRVTVTDQASGEPTLCRVNVVGPDGNFYQPQQNSLSTYSLLTPWPSPGRRGNPRQRPPFGYGNRPGKAPHRYFGHFFYSSGNFEVRVPAGPVRVEVWKGFEFTPVNKTVQAQPGETVQLECQLSRAVPMAELGYYSGDSHLHLFRSSDADDDLVFDLLEAEDVRYGGVLTYNYRTSSYVGRFRALEYPPRLGLGPGSVRVRGDYQIMSGQEYRSGQYGHMNVFLTDRLVLQNTSLDPNTWPVYGMIGPRVRAMGGYAWHAHGGYGKEIYANYVTGAAQGVELLQFGVYRGIGLEGWYHMLNTGFRFAAHGASDFPACRKLSDCRTYVASPQPPNFREWIHGVSDGRSFFTTGPLLLLEVDGQGPGAMLRPDGPGPHSVEVSVRVRCEVTPVSHLELIVNGRIVQKIAIPAEARRGRWVEIRKTLPIGQSSWIAARAWSVSPTGHPDAEAHTNPVYVYLDGQAPYQAASLEWLLERLDEQIARHQQREFEGRKKALEYFAQIRERLLEIRRSEGQPIPRDVNRAPDRRDLEGTEVLSQLDDSRNRYQTRAAWEQRIDEIRDGVLRSMKLKPLPEKGPLNPIVHSRREYTDYIVENVALETLPGFYCTGNLYRPKNYSGSLAAVLCPHGHFRPLGRFRANHQIRCAQLAKMGAAVFSYSMVGWQDSQQTDHYEDPNVIGLQTWNSIRVIDYLLQLPDVDPERVGVTGASGGGSQSILAAIADDRVRATVPVTILYHWYTGCNCESGMGIMNHPSTNAIELAACMAPRPSLFISCGFTFADRIHADRSHFFGYIGFPFIQQVYRSLGVPDSSRHLHLADEAHDYGPSKRQAMYAFFAEHLGLKLLPERLDTIKIESPEQMRVFDETHKLPETAAMNREQVMRAYDRFTSAAGRR